MSLIFPLGGNIIVIGCPGSGKTVLMKKAYCDAYGDDIVQIWYDLEEDYDKLSSFSDETVYHLEDVIDAIKRGAIRIHFEEESPFADVQFKRWNKLCELAYELKETVLFNDEVMQVCELWGIAPWHRAVLSRGRKRQVSLVQATQRTQNVHKDLIALSWVRIAFWVDSYDQNALKPWFPELKWLEDKPDYWFIYKYKRDTQLCRPLSLTGIEKNRRK